MSDRRGLARRVLATLAVASAAVTNSGANVARADVNTSPSAVVVYDDNIENMLPASCADGFVFDRLFNHIKTRPKSPDIFTVQQISNATRLAALVKRMTAELPGTYAGTGPCQNLEPTRSSQDRVENIAIRLHDTVANKDVSVASFHWPTSTWRGPDCADENRSEANDAVNRLGGNLKILAGDANTTTGTKSWWQHAMDEGYRDPIAEKCGGRVCSSAYNTTAHHRFDFLLVRNGHGFSNVANISDAMAGGPYSNHHSVTAYVKY